MRHVNAQQRKLDYREKQKGRERKREADARKGTCVPGGLPELGND